MLTLAEPYAPRPIRFLDEWAPEGWRLKMYGIAYGRPHPRAELVQAACRVALDDALPRAAGTNHYGVGFVGVHEGRGANFVFVDWWADENELHHHVYVGPADRPEALASREDAHAAACVWDLRVLAFERDAWLEAVLRNPGGPDLEAYLSRHLNEEA